MTKEEYLESFIKAYQRYYDIHTDAVPDPFAAMAVFISHNEQYFLVKSAKVADIDSEEYVYFILCDELTSDMLQTYDQTAWEDGLSKVTPNYGHRNTDITLYIICNHMSDDAFSLTRKLHHYKSYKHGFFGWSNYRLVTIETSSERTSYNRQGRTLKKLVSNIIKQNHIKE